jgi:hypothetical protein
MKVVFYMEWIFNGELVQRTEWSLLDIPNAKSCFSAVSMWIWPKDVGPLKGPRSSSDIIAQIRFSIDLWNVRTPVLHPMRIPQNVSTEKQPCCLPRLSCYFSTINSPTTFIACSPFDFPPCQVLTTTSCSVCQMQPPRRRSRRVRIAAPLFCLLKSERLFLYYASQHTGSKR